MIRRTLLTMLALVGCCCLTGIAAEAKPATEDARLAVDLLFDEGTHPSLQAQAKKAWPVVLERVIPVAERGRFADSIEPFTLLLKAQPTNGGSHVVFHADRLWQAISQANKAYISEYPAFYLRLILNNASGQAMPQSQQELMQDALQYQNLIGIQILQASSAPFIGISIRWLDASSFQLSVQSQSKLEEFSETVSVATDPLVAMQQAVHNTLLRARDAYAVYPSAASMSDDIADVIADSYSAANISMLNIRWSGSLSDQVFLENKLRHDPRVLRLQPSLISRNEQVYALELKQADDQWLSSWFAAIGLRAERDAHGWLVQQP